MNVSQFLLLGTAFALGLRHGIDWDHIAAIADISGSEVNRKTSFINAMSYAIGHGLVIIVLGLLAVILGVRLPDWVDNVMEPIVGVTLIILGIWIVAAILIQRSKFKLVSKWGLLLKGLQKLLHSLEHKTGYNHQHQISESTERVGLKSAFGIGMIHGIGAETPTQLLIFVTAAGVGGALVGTLLVLSFVLGLLISNSFIALVSISGFAGIQKNPRLYLGLGGISGIFSIILGVLYLTGKGAILPAILGG